MRYDVLVEVVLRPGIADPQGATIERSLPVLGFTGIEQVRVGKAIRFAIDAADEPAAQATALRLSERLLSNPVLEQCRVDITPGEPGEPAP